MRIEARTFVDIIAHDGDGIVDLGVDACGLGVGEVASAARRVCTGIPGRNVGVVSAFIWERHDVLCTVL